MTYNVDEGTDFIEVQSATTLLQFIVAAGQTITQVRATNPPARMQAVATQILAAQPDLVSLQEVDRWSSGSFNPITGACGPTSLEFDLLQELLDALAAQGGRYQVAVRATQFEFPPTPGLILPGTFLCVQFRDENVILARTDLEVSEFQWSNPQSAQFVNKVSLPTPAGLIPLPRVWVSVDAQFHGSAFRFIGTHLDTVAPIRELQGTELRNGPANTSLPVIVAMDSNAQAFPLPQDPTYMDFIARGYNDVWSELFPLAPGLTCCQVQLVNNPVSQLTQRIDLILTLGDIEAQRIALFGADPGSMTPGGLWPSDHAGVAARLKVEDDEHDEGDE
jgi:endonuclease/exonuclease/phosphatase family metal-dependent hydrolase